MRAADVAAAAAVSESTVSLVVNGKWEGRVAEATAERVLAIVERLGYVVHESARHLATGTSGAIAIIAPAFTNPFYSKVSLGAAARLGGRFQLVFPVPDRNDDHRTMLARVLAMRLDGAIIASPTRVELAAVPDDLPVVVLDAPDLAGVRPSVNLDVGSGVSALAAHLRQLGHEMVAYLDGTPETATLTARRAALAGEFAGLVLHDRFATVVEPSAAWERAVAMLPDIVARGVTAVVCCTDQHAYGVMRALRELGLRVPHDVSVVGFDDQPLSAFMSPALTTVSFPASELGEVGAGLLIDLIEGRATPALQRVLPASLVVRGSTAVARTRP